MTSRATSAALAVLGLFAVLSSLACADTYAADDPVIQVGRYAEDNWNCARASCQDVRAWYWYWKTNPGRVNEGEGQPEFVCAEFVSRALAAGGYVPNLGPYDPQDKYENYQYEKVKYNLVRTSKRQRLTWSEKLPPLVRSDPPNCLEDFLIKRGWRQVDITTGNVHKGVAIFGNDDSDWGHVVVGVGNNVWNGHNVARQHKDLSHFQNNGGVQAIYVPP